MAREKRKIIREREMIPPVASGRWSELYLNGQYILYKIYYSTQVGEDELVYIGKAKQPLQDRLRKQFFKGPESRLLDINWVSRIEYIPFASQADQYVAENILVNRYKPKFNRKHKAKDRLTLEMPDFPSLPYECVHFERWKREINERDRELKTLEMEKMLLLDAHRNKRREIFSQNKLSAEEKVNRWSSWLVEFYEPAMEKLNDERRLTW